MKKEDVSKIKLGSPAFTKKWWQDRRPKRLNRCGVGKALDALLGEIDTIEKAVKTNLNKMREVEF